MMTNRRVQLLWIVAGLVFPIFVHAENVIENRKQIASENYANSDELDILLDCCDDKPVKDNRTVVKLGYLAAVKGDLSNR